MSFKPTWLYIKQHNETGLKYFGKTVCDPFSYPGSGLHWRRHLRKHGNNVSTIWARLFETEKELVEFALDFSSKFSITESSEWANLKPENGLDGNPPGIVISEETKSKMREKARRPKSESWKKSRSETLKGKPARNKGAKHSAESKQLMSLKAQGKSNAMYGKSHSEESRKKISDAMKGKSPPNKGSSMSEEQKQVLRDKALLRPKVVCPYCSKELDLANFARYHGDRCKLK